MKFIRNQIARAYKQFHSLIQKYVSNKCSSSSRSSYEVNVNNIPWRPLLVDEIKPLERMKNMT
jgi:hypothetical protein